MKKIAIVIIAFMVTIVFSQVPKLINYQGKLTNPSGVAVDGTATITFRFYSLPTGGTIMWSENHPAVDVNRGLFDVILGSVTPFSDTLRFNRPYYLELVVDGEVMNPRQSFSSVPYSMRSVYADSAFFVASGSSSIVTSLASDNYLPRIRVRDTLENSLIYQTDGGSVGIATVSPSSTNRLEVLASSGAGHKAVVGNSPTGHSGWLGSDLYGVYGGYDSNNYGYVGDSVLVFMEEVQPMQLF
jgi:hypothetical protein